MIMMINTLLHYCSFSLPKTQAMLAANPALLNARGHLGATPLMTAALNHQLEVVAFLISQGADQGLHDAVALDDLARIGTLLAADPTLARGSGGGLPPLYCAAVNGREAAANLLLSFGADLDANGPHLITPMHGAAEYGHVGMINWLITHGADVDRTTESGVTPLHVAAYAGQREAATALVAMGANLRATNADGDTPADLAALRGHTLLAQTLAVKGG